MDLDLITLVLILVILGYLAVTRVKMYKKHQDGLDIIKERKAIKKVFTGQITTIIYIAIMLFSFIGFIVVMINYDKITDVNSWLIILGVIFFTLLIDLIRVKVMHTTYYNDHGMFVDNEYIRFNSIKSLSQNKSSITTTLQTFNNKKYMVPTKTLNFLKDKINTKTRKRAS